MREEIDLSKMSLLELIERIREYEKKYGKNLKEFMDEFNEDEASYEELVDVFIWEELEEELKRRLDRERVVLEAANGDILKILAPLRLRVLSILARNGPMTLTQIAKKIKKTQASALMALKPLVRIGLVNVRIVSGRKIYWTNVREITIKLA